MQHLIFCFGVLVPLVSTTGKPDKGLATIWYKFTSWHLAHFLAVTVITYYMFLRTLGHAVYYHPVTHVFYIEKSCKHGVR